MGALPEHWEKDVGRIARMSAARFRGGAIFTHAERVDLAEGGIIEYVSENGWPDGDKPLFRAADNAIRHEEREYLKHLKHGRYWYEVPGISDPIGEAITDKIAVWQIAWAFTDGQWAAIWALAEVMKTGGGRREAARLLGMNVNAFALQISLARKRARALWVAPGDTPPRLWAADYKVPRDRQKDPLNPGSQLRKRMSERARHAARTA